MRLITVAETGDTDENHKGKNWNFYYKVSSSSQPKESRLTILSQNT